MNCCPEGNTCSGPSPRTSVFKPQNSEQGMSDFEVIVTSAVRNSLFDILNFKYFWLEIRQPLSAQQAVNFRKLFGRQAPVAGGGVLLELLRPGRAGNDA
jgi:hypothetical protein